MELLLAVCSAHGLMVDGEGYANYIFAKDLFGKIIFAKNIVGNNIFAKNSFASSTQTHLHSPWSGDIWCWVNVCKVTLCLKCCYCLTHRPSLSLSTSC